MYLIYNDISIIIIIAISFIALGYSAIAHYSYSFLHFLLIFESMVLSVCLIFSSAAYVHDKVEGDIAVLFVVAIVAAETAIAITFYIRAMVEPPVRFFMIRPR
jgi:NADH:ubiquinone oxidoreductase subunit K